MYLLPAVFPPRQRRRDQTGLGFPEWKPTAARARAPHPARLFAFALTQTAAGGEIDVLDPAGYGAVTITKAISIVNDGVGVAAIGVSSGNAITINAGANDSVHLRGLTINGIGGSSSGILFNWGNLAIENCVVRGIGTSISIAPSTSSSFSVSNTIASSISGNGIEVVPFGSAVVSGVV